jgi:hypothetical protein
MVVKSWCRTETIAVLENGELVSFDKSRAPKQTSVTQHQVSLLSKGTLKSLVIVLILAATVNWATRLLETIDLARPIVW